MLLLSIDPSAGGLELRVLSETASTITLAWNLVAGAVGYRGTSEGYLKPDGSQRWAQTFSTQMKFSKAVWYRVDALSVLASDVYP